MIIQITVRNGVRVKQVSFDNSRLSTISDLLSNPGTNAQIGAPEGAAFRVNGGQVTPSAYALQNGDEVVVETKTTEKN